MIKSWYKQMVCLGVITFSMITTIYPMTKEEDLLQAAGLGDLERVRGALEEGADVNAQDKSDYTPLHNAADIGRKEIVEWLLKHGANINAQNSYGDTPLYRAALKGYKEIVELLLKHNADVNAKGRWNNTPLHKAALCGYKEIVEILLEHNADINARNNDHDTPLSCAASWGDKEIVKLLLKIGVFFDSNVHYARVLSLFEQKIVKGDIAGIKEEFFGSEYKKSPEDLLQGLLIAIGQGHEEIVKILLGYLVSQGSLTCEVVIEAQHALTTILKRKNLSEEQRERYQRMQEAIRSLEAYSSDNNLLARALEPISIVQQARHGLAIQPSQTALSGIAELL